MPNWSFNSMSVRGDDKEVQRLRDTIKRVETDKDGTQIEIPFSFQNVIPMPEELKDTIAPTKEPNSKEAKALRAKYGCDNWYDWRWEHWGTKWDACDCFEEKGDDEQFFVRFNTAWSFPTPVVVELSKQFPNLEFVYDAEEESGVYDFTVVFKNGRVVSYAENERDEETGEVKAIEKPVGDFWK